MLTALLLLLDCNVFQTAVPQQAGRQTRKTKFKMF